VQHISQEEIYEHFFAVLRHKQLSLDINTLARCGKLQRQRYWRRTQRKLYTHTYSPYLQYVEKRYFIQPFMRQRQLRLRMRL